MKTRDIERIMPEGMVSVEPNCNMSEREGLA